MVSPPALLQFVSELEMSTIGFPFGLIILLRRRATSHHGGGST